MRFQFQAKIVAWVDIILSSVVLLFLLLGAFVILTEPDMVIREIEKDDTEEKVEMTRFMAGSTLRKIVLLIPSMCYFVGEIILGIYLLKAAETLNYKKLRTWYVVTITMSVVIGIISLPALFSLANSGITLLFISWNLAFTVYSLWIVHLLRNEIKANSLPGQFTNYSQPPPYQASFINANYTFPPPTASAGATNGLTQENKAPMKN